MENNWVMLTVGGALLSGLVGLLFTLGGWFMGRLVKGIEKDIDEVKEDSEERDKKLEQDSVERDKKLEEKMVTNGAKHYAKEEDLNVRVSVLEERTKKM